jgi:hypothetical protein
LHADVDQARFDQAAPDDPGLDRGHAAGLHPAPGVDLQPVVLKDHQGAAVQGSLVVEQTDQRRGKVSAPGVEGNLGVVKDGSWATSSVVSGWSKL